MDMCVLVDSKYRSRAFLLSLKDTFSCSFLRPLFVLIRKAREGVISFIRSSLPPDFRMHVVARIAGTRRDIH